jgi:hypothetical protein
MACTHGHMDLAVGLLDQGASINLATVWWPFLSSLLLPPPLLSPDLTSPSNSSPLLASLLLPLPLRHTYPKARFSFRPLADPLTCACTRLNLTMMVLACSF